MKKRILCLNGPNLNILSKRNHALYGTKTIKEIERSLALICKKEGLSIAFFQSNHEGSLIDFIQKKTKKSQGILINAGALAHYGYALHDALLDSRLPIVSVHLSDISEREDFRKNDINSDISLQVVEGLKEKSYEVGLQILIKHL